MSSLQKRAAAHDETDPQEIREQEVLRANRELSAYFRGQRTEREARAALKIIKAFIRDRERIDAPKRRPLPGTSSAKPGAVVKTRSTGRKARRDAGRRPRSRTPKTAGAAGRTPRRVSDGAVEPAAESE